MIRFSAVLVLHLKKLTVFFSSQLERNWLLPYVFMVIIFFFLKKDIVYRAVKF